jgi:hypothetical protein
MHHYHHALGHFDRGLFYVHRKEMHPRVYANSGKGYFSWEWVSAESIGKALAESPGISSFTLQSVYV